MIWFKSSVSSVDIWVGTQTGQNLFLDQIEATASEIALLAGLMRNAISFSRKCSESSRSTHRYSQKHDWLAHSRSDRNIPCVDSEVACRSVLTSTVTNFRV